MKFKLNPISFFATFLMAFSGVALVYNWSVNTLIHLALTVGFGLLLYTLYTRFTGKKKNLWNTLISCLLLFLLLHPGDTLLSLAFPLIAVFTTLSLKFFGEWKGSPLVNPAAAGLLFAAAVGALLGFDVFISWWGVSFWTLPLLGKAGVSVSFFLLLFWLVFGFHVWRKWKIFFTFLLGFAVLTYVQAMDFSSFPYIYLDSHIYFFTAVMLCEPKTSPFLPWKQAVYGLFAVCLYAGLSFLHVPHFELFTIVAANLLQVALSAAPQRFKEKAKNNSEG